MRRGLFIEIVEIFSLGPQDLDAPKLLKNSEIVGHTDSIGLHQVVVRVVGEEIDRYIFEDEDAGRWGVKHHRFLW